MPTLKHALQAQDMGYLRIVAERWGVEIESSELNTAIQQIERCLLDPGLIEEVVEALPGEERSALDDLIRHEGKMPWSLFTKRHGVVQKMGPGRRDRERPDRQPQSSTENLWYYALVARAFFDTSEGAQEFAYLPEDFIPLLPTSGGGAEHPLGRPASPIERAHLLPASDTILDHATTLLAALRIGLPDFQLELPTHPSLDLFLRPLLSSAGLLTPEGEPDPEPTRAFLEAPRGQALADLNSNWLNSPDFDELSLLPHLQAEGEWNNHPQRTRKRVLGFLQRTTADTWWSLESFIAAIKDRQPDFQRPAGDYDSWYLRDLESGAYLRGFEHWDRVDGALIRFMITGPMHALGLLDLASPDPETAPTAFRFNRWTPGLLRGKPPKGLHAEKERIHIRSNGFIGVPRLAPRAVRYQIARFTQWEGEKGDEYRYRLTPSSLSRAGDQNLRVSHLLTIIQRDTDNLPPNILKALKRWESHGSEAHIQRLTVLQLGSPEILQALRKSRAARFLGDPLGPTTIEIIAGAEENVLAVLAEMGYLGDVQDSSHQG